MSSVEAHKKTRYNLGAYCLKATMVAFIAICLPEHKRLDNIASPPFAPSAKKKQNCALRKGWSTSFSLT
jgi:hypothetical protein